MPSGPRSIRTDIINCWYKASALALSDTNAVSSWADSSTAGGTAVQATGGWQPVYRTNQINTNLPAVLFTQASGHYLEASGTSAAYTSGVTAFALIQWTSTATNATMYGAVGGTSGEGFFFRINGTTGVPQANDQNVGPLGVASGGVSTGVWTLISFDFTNQSGGAWHHFTNGAANGNGTSTQLITDTGHLIIGSNAGASEFFNGYIAELVAYNGVLSDADRAQVNSYFQDTYAITVSDYVATGQTLRPDADLDTTGWATAPLASKLADQSDSTVVTSTI
jgi:Concanavalin A-like lectin/glucanases superfamily